LYRLGSAVVDALAAGAPIDRLARYFEYWILRLQGVYPELRVCPGCSGALEGGAVMPPREHMFLCHRCAPAANGTGISAAALGFLRAAGRTAPERMDSLVLDARASRELETAHRRLLHTHLEKELKSVRVLREMGRG
jgi:recombinational DNA repair protein (RecF pathway)